MLTTASSKLLFSPFGPLGTYGVKRNFDDAVVKLLKGVLASHSPVGGSFPMHIIDVSIIGSCKQSIHETLVLHM